MISLLPPIALAALLPVAAAAGPTDCSAAATQAEMNACAQAEYAAADAALNAVWPEARAVADSAGAGESLLDAQRKWIAYRDAACEAESAPYAGGSIQPLIRSDCLTRLTERRSADLGAFARP